MKPTRHKGIIAYGTEEDRKKLAILAEAYGLSGSELIVKMIRDRFAEIYGDSQTITMDQ